MPRLAFERSARRVLPIRVRGQNAATYVMTRGHRKALTPAQLQRAVNQEAQRLTETDDGKQITVSYQMSNGEWRSTAYQEIGRNIELYKPDNYDDDADNDELLNGITEIRIVVL